MDNIFIITATMLNAGILLMLYFIYEGLTLLFKSKKKDDGDEE